MTTTAELPGPWSPGGPPWPVIDVFYLGGGHAELGTGADARGPALLIVDKGEPRRWRVRQILDDPAGDHDWGLDVEVDLDASDEEGVVVMQLVDAGRRD